MENMSEFSESYHLLASNEGEGTELLRRASLEGYVFPVTGSWVTILPEGEIYHLNERLIQANLGLLLYWAHAEDHGWTFSLYEGDRRICHYEAFWEEELAVDMSAFRANPLIRLVNANPANAEPASEAAIAELLNMNNIEEVFEGRVVDRIAQLLGLEHYEWLSYEGVANNAEEFRESGIVFTHVTDS